MMARQVSPEYEIYNITMLEELERLIDQGLAPEPLNIGLVLGTASQAGHEARGRTSPTWCDVLRPARTST